MRSYCAVSVVFAIAAHIALSCLAQSPVKVVRVWDNAAMLVDSTSTCSTLDLSYYQPHQWAFSVQIAVTNSSTNSGILSLSYELSNDGADFVLSSNIVTTLCQTNSMASNGRGLYRFSPDVARYVRLKALCRQTNLYLTAWIAIQ